MSADSQHLDQRSAAHIIGGREPLAELERAQGFPFTRPARPGVCADGSLHRVTQGSRAPGSLRARRLASSGLVALMEAIDRFDPAKGASFEQYAGTASPARSSTRSAKQDWASRSVRREGRRIERAATPSSPAPARCRPRSSSRTSSARPSMTSNERRGHRPFRHLFPERPLPRRRGLAAMEVARRSSRPEASTTRSRACSVQTATRLCVPASPGCPSVSAMFSRSCTCRSSPVPRSAGCSASASRACHRFSPGSGAS